MLTLLGCGGAPGAAGAAQLVVSWDDNSTGEDGYVVERATNGANFAPVATLPANSNSYTDTNLTDGANYWYRVRAFNAVATSTYSNVAFGTTAAGDVTNRALAVSSGATHRLVNLSVRANAGSGDTSLIIGFVIANAPKSILLRAIGPGLSAFTSGQTMSNPMLALMNGSVAVATNDNWGGTSELKNSFSQLGAFSLADGSADAALLRGLGAQAYTAVVSGTDSGLALAEIYDADNTTAPAGRLINLAARARASAGDDVLIVGFVVSGDAPLKVLIRAVGPSLVSSGVTTGMADPQLDLYRGQTLWQHNDDWAGDSALSTAFATVGAFSLISPASKDAAVVTVLPPGAYTAVLSSTNGASGVVLAEVYELP